MNQRQMGLLALELAGQISVIQVADSKKNQQFAFISLVPSTETVQASTTDMRASLIRRDKCKLQVTEAKGINVVL